MAQEQLTPGSNPPPWLDKNKSFTERSIAANENLGINLAAKKVWNIAKKAWKELITGEAGQERDFEWSKKLQELQNKNEWKMAKWKADWDTTQQQLKRWIEAGGNPNAYFQQGAGATAAGPSMTSSSLGGVGSAVGQLRENAQGFGKLFWEIQNLKEDAKTKEINNGTLDVMNKAKIDEIKANVALLEERKELTKQEATQIMTLLPLTEEKTRAEIEEIKNKSHLLIAETRQAIANAKYLDQRRKTEVYNTAREKWKQFFRDTYSIDPDSANASAIIQAILGGKGSEIIGGFFNFIEDARSELGKRLFSNKSAGRIGYNIGKGLRRIPQFHIAGDILAHTIGGTKWGRNNEKKKGGKSFRW